MTAQNALLVLSYKNLSAAEKKEILIKAGVISADQELIGENALLAKSNISLSGTFGIIARKAAMSAAAILSNPITWLVGAVAATTIAIKKMNEAVEEGRDKAQELGSEFADISQELDSYKEKITELTDKIKDQKSSIETVVDSRRQLGKIQDELVNKYGHEAEVINAVTDAINGQSDAINNLFNTVSADEWQKVMNQINNTGFWANAANWRDNYKDQVDRIEHELFNETYSLTAADSRISVEQRKYFKSLLTERGWTYNEDNMFMQYTGSREKALNDILDIQQELSKKFGDDLSKVLSKTLTDSYNSINEVYEKYKEFKDQFVLNSVIFNPQYMLQNGEANGDYLANVLLGLEEEYEAYISAANEDAQKAALQGLANHLREIFSEENIPQLVKDYIKQLFPTIFTEEDTKITQIENAKNLARNKAYDSLYAEASGSMNRTDQEKFREATGFDKKYNAFIEEYKIDSEEELELLDAYIAKYKDLDKAFSRYAQDVKTESPVLDYEGKKDRSNYTADDYIEETKSNIISLGDALNKLQTKTMTSADRMALFKDFPELESRANDLEEAIGEKLVGAIDTLEKTTGKQLAPEIRQGLFELTSGALQANRTLNETFNTIKNSSSVLKEFKTTLKNGDPITESLLSSIAGLSDELDTLVAGFYGGVVTVEELYDAVEKQREVDFERYKQSYIMKQALDENYYKNAIAGHKEVVKLFNEQYKIDLRNYTSYQMAKSEVQKKILGQNMKMISLYYDIEQMQYTDAYAKLENEAKASVGHSYGEYTKVRSLINEYKQAIDDLNQIGWTDFLDELDKMTLGDFDKISGSTKDYKELFDFFERRLEIIDQSLNKLDASLEEVNGSMAKNILIAGKMNIVSKQIQDYTSALTMYENKANQELSKLSADMQEKIKNGSVSITQLIGENGEEVNKTLEEYKKWADKVNDCNVKLLELRETLRDLALEKFNNIAQDYSDQFDILGSSNDLIEKQISLFEEAGQLIGRAFYETQIEASQKQRTILEKEKAALIKEMTSALSSGYIQKGNDEWLEMAKSIQEVDSSILDVDQSIEQLQNSLLELNDKVFERLQNTFSDINSQLSNIVGMISDVDVSDESGVWSDEGLTQLGAYAQQYELARHNVEKYEEEIQKLNQSYSDGLYSTTEYIDKLSDLAQAQWEQANAAEDAKKSILELNKARVELVKEGIQKQIDAYKELIDKQKEALDQEKSIRDYEKTIAEKNKNINKLQNQINLLRNDDSAAANAKRIKLEQELADAKADLEETQYDHSVEAQKEALDKQLEDFEDARQQEIDELEEYLKDVERVQKDSFEIIKKNTDKIAKQIENIAKTHGVVISEAITNSWKSGEGAIASYGTALSSASSGFIQQIHEIEIYLVALQDEADLTADRLVGMLSAKADNLLNEFNAARDSENELIRATNLLNEALIKTLEGNYDISGIIGALKEVQNQVDETKNKLTGSTSTGNVSSSTQKAIQDTVSAVANAGVKVIPDEQVNAIKKQQELDALSFDYYYYWKPKTHEYTAEYKKLSDAVRSGDSQAAIVKNKVDNAVASYLAKEAAILKKYEGFATGVHNLNRTQFAWTQEQGNELVLSPTRNAILTKLNKGDTVLTKDQTDNLFKLSKIDPDSIFGKFGKINGVARVEAPVLSIGNVLTVNGNIDDTNAEKMKTIAMSAINTAFKKFSSEIVKR